MPTAYIAGANAPSPPLSVSMQPPRNDRRYRVTPAPVAACCPHG